MNVMNSISKLDKSLNLLRKLPRITLSNIKDNPGSSKKPKRGRGQHGGDKHGCGNKGSGQRQNFMRLGYETGNTPFYLRFGYEPYYKGHHLRRQYPPLSLLQLQKLIDTSRIDSRLPIDVATICNTGLFSINPQSHEFGFQLTDEGADLFKSKINIEVQWATEQVIAAIERNGGVITTSYYDPFSLQALVNPKKYFLKGAPIPKRMIPPEDAIDYYTDPAFRGYLADPAKVCWEQLVLSQKYGYAAPDIKKDSDYEMLCLRKDPLQVFWGLEPGWVVNLTDKKILKPISNELKEFYELSVVCN